MKLRKNGSELGKIIINVGIALILPLTVFSIIKMVLANKSTDLAAWKKIVARCIMSLVLLFFFEYILITIDSISGAFMNGLWKTRINLEKTNGYKPFELTIEQSIMKNLRDTGGITSLAYSLEFSFIIILQAMFFIKYIIRFCTLTILFIIAPVIIIVHSFSLILGRDVYILGEFFRTYIVFSFMQPLHALFYLIFFFSFSEIAINVPIFGMILLYALYRAGNIAKAMFGWEMSSSILSR